jgi:DNA-binding LacI/PurR family transcriptional regulator
VSQPTVSRALRGDLSVSVETRRRIIDAAARLNYTLDRRGSKLRVGTTGVIAVVVLTMPGQTRSAVNPFYMMLLGAIEAAATARGYDLLVSFQNEPDTFRAGFRQAGDADGVIVVGSARNEAAWGFFTAAADTGERIVCWGAPTDALPTVRCDNHAGASIAVRHLIEGQRTHIAFLGGGWAKQAAYMDRRRGYLGEIDAHGMVPIEAPDVNAGSREEEGFQAVMALLEQRPDVDAIFAASDLLAIGALRAARACHRAVPVDLAIVGFDGIPSVTHVSPTLTTVEQDSALAGEALVSSLIDMMNGQLATVAIVPMNLVVRESSLCHSPD